MPVRCSVSGIIRLFLWYLDEQATLLHIGNHARGNRCCTNIDTGLVSSCSIHTRPDEESEMEETIW